MQAHAFFRFMKIAQSRPREQAPYFEAVDRNECGMTECVFMEDLCVYLNF